METDQAHGIRMFLKLTALTASIRDFVVAGLPHEVSRAESGLLHDSRTLSRFQPKQSLDESEEALFGKSDLAE
jgi:hypothetical protein